MTPKICPQCGSQVAVLIREFQEGRVVRTSSGIGFLDKTRSGPASGEDWWAAGGFKGLLKIPFKKRPRPTLPD